MAGEVTLFAAVRRAWLRWRTRDVIVRQPGPPATVARLAERVRTDNWDGKVLVRTGAVCPNDPLYCAKSDPHDCFNPDSGSRARVVSLDA